MAGTTQQILFRDPQPEGLREIKVYERLGGYQALKKALQLAPRAVVEEVKKSGLRGRGGAGFPTGVKWGFLPEGVKPRYLCVNADESEPGTYKDRELIERDPHLVIEGTIISSFAIQANTAYFYIRGEFAEQARIIEKAIAEAHAAGYLGKNIQGSGYDLEIWVHRGAGAYICGEETALLESLEGKRGFPRIKPPFPAVKGLFGQPTIINNVETLANVPLILDRGGAWFAAIGRDEKNTGTKIFSVSGHVKEPRNVEIALGSITVRELVDKHCGGVWPGRQIKAVIPGGSSVPVLTNAELDVLLDYDSLAKAGTMLGSGGVIVMDESVCMVWACHNLLRFYAHESCGQCTPCREGTRWSERVLGKVLHAEKEPNPIARLLDISDNMASKTICPLAEAARGPLESFIKKFRDEFDYHAEHGRCDIEGAP